MARPFRKLRQRKLRPTFRDTTRRRIGRNSELFVYCLAKKKGGPRPAPTQTPATVRLGRRPLQKLKETVIRGRRNRRRKRPRKRRGYGWRHQRQLFAAFRGLRG